MPVDCPFCRYSLAGHDHAANPTCPECGRLLDHETVERRRRQNRRRATASMLIVLVAAYGPFTTWLLLEDYPWDEYRWSWVRLLPIMPGMLPGELLGRAIGVHGEGGRLLMSTIGLVAIGVPALLLAARSWRWCAGVASIVLLACSGLTFMTRGLFLM